MFLYFLQFPSLKISEQLITQTFDKEDTKKAKNGSIPLLGFKFKFAVGDLITSTISSNDFRSSGGTLWRGSDR